MTSMENAVGKAIKDKRKALGLTQEKLAALFNETEPLDLTTTGNDISRYESGINIAPSDKFHKLITLGG